MIPELRSQFNRNFTDAGYAALLATLEQRSGVRVEFRVAETPIFIGALQLEQMAAAGAKLTADIMGNSACLAAARSAIPAGYWWPAKPPIPTSSPPTLPSSVTPQASWFPGSSRSRPFPPSMAISSTLSELPRGIRPRSEGLATFSAGSTSSVLAASWPQTILAGHDPENVVLTEIDPLHQKTCPDFRDHLRPPRHPGRRHPQPSSRSETSSTTATLPVASFPFIASTTAPSPMSSSAAQVQTTLRPGSRAGTSNGLAIPTGTSSSASSPFPGSRSPPAQQSGRAARRFS